MINPRVRQNLPVGKKTSSGCRSAAGSFDTDWAGIATLYGQLAALVPSPVVALNRAVAVSMAEGPAAGLALIDALIAEPSLRGYHLLPSARADLLARLGRLSEARVEFERAASLTRNARQRESLLARAAACARARRRRIGREVILRWCRTGSFDVGRADSRHGKASRRKAPIRMKRRSIGSACVAAALCLGACAGSPPSDRAGDDAGARGLGAAGGGAAGTGGAGWRLVWSDEFEGPAGSAVDPHRWTFDLGNNNGWGNYELEDYTNRTSNAALDGTGNLVVTARRETLGGQSYTSARLLTQGKASWTYGRFEARVKIPFGQGLWPAFWMLGDSIASVGWPACGEIDIMENVGKEPAIVHGTMHGLGPAGAYGVGGPLALSGAARYADAFHLFAVEWEPDAIRWYVDETQYFSTTRASIPAGATWAFNQPFFLLLNVAVGGGWPGAPDGTTVFPQTLTVDYVRVYQR